MYDLLKNKAIFRYVKLLIYRKDWGDLMRIRKAEPKDAKGISAVHIDSWKTTYSGIVPQDYLDQLNYREREQQWQKNLSASTVYLAETDDGQVIGFSTGGKERTGNYGAAVGEVYAIYILEQYQRRGVGRKLLEPILDHLHQQGIDEMIVLALEENPACGFYQNLGGKAIKRLEIEIAGRPLRETVFYWYSLKESGLALGR